MGRQIDIHAGGTRSFFSATMSPFCLSQDILDAWLRCQESWLYLEPIFNSEDIMKQMPVEGRKFNKVDRIWRNIMAKTVSDTRVLQATSQPNMLVSYYTILNSIFLCLKIFEKNANVETTNIKCQTLLCTI